MHFKLLSAFQKYGEIQNFNKGGGKGIILILFLEE